MHSPERRGIALQDPRTGIQIDAEVASGFLWVGCGLGRTERSLHSNIAGLVLDAGVAGDAQPDVGCCAHTNHA